MNIDKRQFIPANSNEPFDFTFEQPDYAESFSWFPSLEVSVALFIVVCIFAPLFTMFLRQRKSLSFSKSLTIICVLIFSASSLPLISSSINGSSVERKEELKELSFVDWAEKRYSITLEDNEENNLSFWRISQPGIFGKVNTHPNKEYREFFTDINGDLFAATGKKDSIVLLRVDE